MQYAAFSHYVLRKICIFKKIIFSMLNIQDYFFDHRLLTNGAPPNDRGCRACGKIGHLVADCPRHVKNVYLKKRKKIQFKCLFRKRSADMRKKAQKDRPRTQSEQQQQVSGFHCVMNLGWWFPCV